MSMLQRLREHSGPQEHAVPWLLAGALFAVLWLFAWLRFHGFESSYDAGYFGQAAHLIRNGKGLYISLRGLHFLADHASFLFLPLAALTSLLPTMPLLLAVQAAAFAVGAVLLYRIGREMADLSTASATALTVAYCLYPPVINVNLADFHPEAIAVPALFAAALLVERQNWPLYGLACLVVCLSREDLAITVAALGVIVIASGHRLAGLVTVVAAGVWFLLLTQFIMPSFADGQFVQAARHPKYGNGTAEIAVGIITSPKLVIEDLLESQRVRTLAALLVPVVFLPLAAPKWLLPGIPLYTLYLLSNVPAAHTIDHQYTVSVIPFVFVAAACALRRMDRTRFRSVGLLTLTVVSLGSQGLLGNARPWRGLGEEGIDDARREAVSLVPDDVGVSASSNFLGHLSDRQNLFFFPMPFLGYEGATNDRFSLDERRAQVEYVVVDGSNIGAHAGTRDQQVLMELRASIEFREVFAEQGIVVLRRE